MRRKSAETRSPYRPIVSWAVPCPLVLSYPTPAGSMAHDLRLASWRRPTPASFDALPCERTHRGGGFSWCYFSTLLHAPSAVHRDVSCLRTAHSEYIWKNAVAFLPNTLRAGTRTLFSFQGAVELFSRGEEEPEMYRLKPEAPNHWDVSPVACGGLKPFSVI